jgi:hypothetical protein
MIGDGSTGVEESPRSRAEMRPASAAVSHMLRILADRSVQVGAGRADTAAMQTLVCRACGGVLQFGADGWQHRDQIRRCDRVVVAWPPPGREDDDDEEPRAAAAG